MKKYISKSENETQEIAFNLAKQNLPRVIALSGDLGTGKTTFIQGFAKGLGIREKIISPTFVLMRQHKIPNTEKLLYHVDLYRLEDNTKTKSLGLEEIINDSSDLILIEWAEKMKGDLPNNTIWINFKIKNGNLREITIQ